MQNQQNNIKETKEPLAKFHAKLDSSGRLIIPQYIRNIYGLKPGDFVLIEIRKVEIDRNNRVVYVKNQFKISAKINVRGAIVIPKQYRERYRLEPGELVEVLLLDHHAPDEDTTYTTYTYIFL